ncbi:MAG: mechanosensitive ion channel, partial [Candidatus Hydrogenedentes bacterium]|nr:mechanosensitive ion channel [Candidatus Hydrogenedentota bacterium]
TQIANTMRAQLQSQRDLLQALNQDYQRYSTQLNTLVSQERELATVVGEFGDFIDANILWSGGARILRPSDLANIHEALYWLIAPDAWQKTLSGLTDDLLGNPLHYGLATLSFLILLYCCVAFRPRLQALGEQARKKWHTTYNQTPAALAITFIQTLPAPLVLAFAAWRLAAVQGTLFPGALAQGLTSVAVLCLILGFTRQMFMPLGLVEAHFEWTAGQVRGTRHHFGLLLLVLAPLVFLIFCFEYQPVEDWKTSLGRVAFLAAMGAVLVTLFPLLARVLRAMLADETTWLSEHHGARLFLLLVAAGLPLLLALVAVSGYYYTALQLSVRLFWTATYCLALLFAFAMMRRWLVVTRRKLAVEQARRRRDTAKDDSGDKTVQEFTAEELDLARIDTQTQNLLRSVAVLALFFGVYFIWAGILPALKILERQELWHTRMEVEQQVPTQAGAPSEKQVTAVVRLQPVTAADAVFALLIAAFTIVAVQNLPSLIEIILLRWLKLGSGERYATIAIVRYTLVALGVFFVLRALGVGWNNVQWLLAAIGLGLGFGLQEIFANFVSGLILLFERPVRVGDIVTIGDKSGVVSRIRIRATTVTDWDKKDLVIPNKELITSQVMNWTLTDTTLRLKLRVGVAYGSDLAQVRETLLRVIREHPDVLKDPKPLVILEQFGASSVDFDVFVYVKLENGGEAKTELHLNIFNALRAAGIEIPFPQQDIHLRSGLENPSPPRTTQSPS